MYIAPTRRCKNTKSGAAVSKAAAAAFFSLLFLALTLSASENLQSVPQTYGATVEQLSGNPSPEAGSSDSTRIFTKEELSRYNGSEGKPAYVAVDGIVYDVTPVKAWKKGKHKGRHTAGTELGEAIKKKSPHGVKVLKKLKVVGRLSTSAE